jgi:hypothetical protein
MIVFMPDGGVTLKLVLVKKYPTPSLEYPEEFVQRLVPGQYCTVPRVKGCTPPFESVNAKLEYVFPTSFTPSYMHVTCPSV